LAAGGMGALRSAMIFGALPFSLVMALMTLSLLKSLFWTHRHQLDGPEPSDVENYVVPEL
jgi:choline-glycine betaine transporter